MAHPNEQESNFPPKMGSPARNALFAAGITRLEQLTSYTEKEILKLHGMGPKAMGMLRLALEEKGLRFKAG